MPKAFDKCAKSGKVRTVTKGPAKGRLICLPKGAKHPVLGHKRPKGRRRG